jgi:hypothetical protein
VLYLRADDGHVFDVEAATGEPAAVPTAEFREALGLGGMASSLKLYKSNGGSLVGSMTRTVWPCIALVLVIMVLIGYGVGQRHVFGTGGVPDHIDRGKQELSATPTSAGPNVRDIEQKCKIMVEVYFHGSEADVDRVVDGLVGTVGNMKGRGRLSSVKIRRTPLPEGSRDDTRRPDQ